LAVSLADSMFLSVSPDAARGKVLAFLAFSFAPFVVLAQFIGPFLDRTPGGRRVTIVVLSFARGGLMVAIMKWIDSLTLFALMFVVLVLAKVYSVSRSAVMPTVVPSSDHLMAANGQVGRLTGVVGILAGGPAALLQVIDSRVSLAFAATCFVLAGILALSLPRGVAGARTPESALERTELHLPVVTRAGLVMAALKVANGFLFFHLAFWLRTEKAGTAWFALALAVGSIATLVANSLAGVVRRVVREHFGARGFAGGRGGRRSRQCLRREYHRRNRSDRSDLRGWFAGQARIRVGSADQCAGCEPIARLCPIRDAQSVGPGGWGLRRRCAHPERTGWVCDRWCRRSGGRRDLRSSLLKLDSREPQARGVELAWCGQVPGP